MRANTLWGTLPRRSHTRKNGFNNRSRCAVQCMPFIGSTAGQKNLLAASGSRNPFEHVAIRLGQLVTMLFQQQCRLLQRNGNHLLLATSHNMTQREQNTGQYQKHDDGARQHCSCQSESLRPATTNIVRIQAVITV